MKNKLYYILPFLVLIACNNTDKKNIIIENNTIEISQEEKELTIEKGKEIALNTFKVLGGNLKKSMGEGGVENAINYCNANASNLMDSLGTYYSANIRRTSNKLRNENNTPTAAEQIILDTYTNGGEMKPVVDILSNGNRVFYAPIKMKPLCISCHGTVGKSLSNDNYAFIKKHYPNDKATGYEVSDFRGIWSIELKK